MSINLRLAFAIMEGGSAAPTSPILTGLQGWLRDDIVKTGGGAPSNGDACDVWNDQSGNSRNFGAPGADPTYVASAQGGQPGLRFTKASSQYMNSGSTALSSFITNSSGTIQVVGKFHAYNTNSDNGDANESLISDSLQYMGLNGRSAASGTLQSYNFDSGYTRAESIIGDTNFHLFTWQHTGGKLYAAIDGGSLTSSPAGDPSGNTGNVTGVIQIAKDGAVFADLTVCEVLFYSTALDAAALLNNWQYAQARYTL